MEQIGKLVTCDHPECDTWCFLKAREKTLSGGYERYTEFEKLPDGWGFHSGKTLCPKHYEELNSLIDSFYNTSKAKEPAS